MPVFRFGDVLHLAMFSRFPAHKVHKSVELTRWPSRYGAIESLQEEHGMTNESLSKGRCLDATLGDADDATGVFLKIGRLLQVQVGGHRF